MDASSIKKGPWTSEEDLILVTYIQQHGPRNWKYVPVNTGLMRCSKSCRLRWTNYLRPGIRRGNFTSHEERIIIHLQSLLGNKWAAIASYLPQRTDNDIKNYWNTHLKKKIKNYKTAIDSINIHLELEPEIEEMSTPQPTLPTFYNTSSTYAASAENISRLLKSWTEPISDSTATSCTTVVTSNANQEQGESALFDISQYESFDWNDNSSMFEMFGDVDAAGEIEDFAEQWRWIK